MTQPTIKTTLKDVAERAGVSQSTVSLYVNGKIGVCSPETAERIESAIAELRYVARRRHPVRESVHAAPHSAALPLSPSSLPRFRSLGMAIPHSGDLIIPEGTADVSSPYADLSTSSQLADQVWKGAAMMADCEDYSLFGYPASVRDTPDPSVFLESAVAGLVLAARHADPRPARLADAGLPVVLIGSVPEIPSGCGAVYPCDSDLVDLALSYLWEIGHRHIAYLAGPTASDPLVKRMTGGGENPSSDAESDPTPSIGRYPYEAVIHRIGKVRAWMRMHGTFDPTLLCIGSRAWHTDSETEGDPIENALDSWLSLPNPPTAVFCASDALALRLIAALQARGKSVPGDISVVGVGDSTAARTSPLVTPFGGLTSVALPGDLIGREAIRMLLRLIEGVAASSCRLAIPPTLLSLRGSARPLLRA